MCVVCGGVGIPVCWVYMYLYVCVHAYTPLCVQYVCMFVHVYTCMCVYVGCVWGVGGRGYMIAVALNMVGIQGGREGRGGGGVVHQSS